VPDARAPEQPPPAGTSYTTNNGTLQLEVWAGPLSTPGRVVTVLFNKGPSQDTIHVEWPVIGQPANATLPVRDVWAMADLPPAQSLTAVVASHGVRVFIVG
jgi:hypothetical protein